MAIKLTAVQSPFIEVELLDGTVKKFDIWATNDTYEKELRALNERLAGATPMAEEVWDCIRKAFGVSTLAENEAAQPTGPDKTNAPQTFTAAMCAVLQKAIQEKAVEVQTAKNPSRPARS